MLAIIGAIISIIGALFLLLAAIGLIRMPDVYNRMQTGTKATTLGTMLFLIGIVLALPSWWPKLLLLILFAVMTNPLSSHVLARAAHNAGIPLAKGSVRDCLETDECEDIGIEPPAGVTSDDPAGKGGRA